MDHLQPAVEILAKLVCGHRGHQIPMGGGHHSKIGFDLLGSTDTLERGFPKDSTQGRLQRGTEFRNLIEEERARVGPLDRTVPKLLVPGQCSLFVAKELDLLNGLGKCRSVHCYEGLTGSFAGVVNRPGHELPAHSTLSVNQDTYMTGSEPLDRTMEFERHERASHPPTDAGIPNHA